MSHPHTFSSTLPFLLLLLLLFSSSASLTVTSLTSFQCDKADHNTLLKIKAELGNPAALASWNPTTNCCSWKGVSCESAGKTLSLTITNANLASPTPIPPSIADLPSLSYLTLSNISKLTGPIPATFTNFTYLHDMVITKTALSGPVPAFIGSMHQLGLLDLSYNQLSGPIPDTLRGEMLYSVDLRSNRLTGTIPATLYIDNVSDPVLLLSSNQLTGPIPPALGKIGFRNIDLSRNQFTGDAAFLFGANANKRTIQIDLSHNQLNFDISRVGFPESLQLLDLSHNKIRGSLPRSLAGLKQLKKLDVSYNQLCGRIPRGKQMGLFTSASYARNKCLCGAPLQSCGGRT